MKQKILFVRAGILACILVSVSLISWETHLRNQNRGVAFDDGGSLWSHHRKRVYQPQDKATVFIGSSRIKYDLDIATWERITGDDAIQLANVGSSPLPVLYNLADDENFKGKLVIDVSEFLFFSMAPYANKTPLDNLAFYQKETPTQQFGFEVNKALESQWLFLDKEEFSLNALLAAMPLPKRENVYEFPDFPAGFTPVTFDRQSYMTHELVADPAQVKQVTDVWEMLGKMGASAQPITDAEVDSIIATVKTSVDKIRARGGKVIFVRTPSSGPMRQMEKAGFPRERFWNKLIAITNAEGIHFEDHPSIAHFECPEWSHLSLTQAVAFTKAFIPLLQQKGWTFPYMNNNIASTKN